MYVYINSQGRVLETITAEQVNQGSDLANRIHFHVEGLTRAQNPTVTAQFRLPDGTTVAKPISANVEDPGYVPESDFDYRVFKPDYPYLFWYCDLDSTLLEQTGTLFCSLIVQVGGQTVMTTVQGMITIAVKESAVDDPNLSLSQYEYLLYWIGDQTAGKYVLKVGDAMSGPLSTPKITTDEIESIGGNAVEMPNGIHAIGDTMSVTLDASGLHIDGTGSSTYVEYDAMGIRRASNYIKFSFSGSNPIIETVNGGSAIRSYMPSKSGFLGALADDVASAYLSYRSEDGHLFLEITKQDGSTINSDVDLPLESAIVGMTYDHDTQTITFTLTSGATVTVPVSDIFQGVVTLDNGGWARENQMSVSVVYDHLTNINGKALTSFASSEQTVGGYPAIVIQTADSNKLTKEQAARYMKAQTGSSYVPEYDYDNPSNPYIMFSNKTLWKPQWMDDLGLVLFSMGTTIVDAESDQTITGTKTFASNVVLANASSVESPEIRLQNNVNTTRIRANGYSTDINTHWLPRNGNTYTLGNAQLKWKELYLSGAASVGSLSLVGNTTWGLIPNQYGGLNVTKAGTSMYSFSDLAFFPQSNGSRNLGASNLKWNNLFISGSLNDGTNSVTVANIANLIKINALAVAEESDIWNLPMTVPSIVNNGAVIDGSKMRLGALYGKCVAWNQLVNIATNSQTQTINGVTITDNRDGSYTINGTATAEITASLGSPFQGIANHVYLLKGCPSGGSASTYRLLEGYSYRLGDTGNGSINSLLSSGNASIIVNIKSGTVCNNLVFWPQFFDLTLSYGSGNEPTTVAQFVENYPEIHYPFDAGSIKGSAVTKIISKGKNLFDNNELTYGGYSTSDGSGGVNVDSIRPSLRILCKPSTDYYLKAFNFTNPALLYKATYIHFWDADGNYLSFTANYNNTIAIGWTTPANAAEMAFQIYSGDHNYYGNLPIDPQIMLVEGSVAPTKYEPYFKEELNIPTAVQGFAQRGIGGVQNELDFEHKKAIARMAEYTFTGNEYAAVSNTNSDGIVTIQMNLAYYLSSPSASLNNNLMPNALCKTYGSAVNNESGSFYFNGTNLFVNMGKTTLADTQAALTKIVYQLDEESVTDLSSIGDLGDFNPYLKIKIGGTVDCDCEVKPMLDASVAVYE